MRYNREEYLKNHKDRCTATTEFGSRCTNITMDSPDGKMLCHLHHPLRTFQTRKWERRLFGRFQHLFE